MKKRELINLGIPAGDPVRLAIDAIRLLAAAGIGKIRCAAESQR